MDDTRRAKIDVLLPILEKVCDAVDELVAQQEADAFDDTPPNLNETTRAQVSEDTHDAALERASERIGEALEKLLVG